jgi:opacity protein-like surface antigen
MRTRSLSVLIVLACVLVAPLTCLAVEPYVGVFVGAAIPQDSDVQSLETRFSDVAFNTSFLFGGKAGLFFDTPVLGGNLGLELEVYHFEPDVDEQIVRGSFPGFTGQLLFPSADVHVTTVGLNGIYRLRLAESPEFPRGRFQPYVGVGIGAFIANLKVSTVALNVPQKMSDTDVKPGVQATAGTRFFLTPHLALFTEYKFTHTANFDFNLFSGLGTFSDGSIGFEVQKFSFGLTTHILAAGLSYHW